MTENAIQIVLAAIMPAIMFIVGIQSQHIRRMQAQIELLIERCIDKDAS